MTTRKNIEYERDLLLENYKTVKKKLEEERLALEEEWVDENRKFSNQTGNIPISNVKLGYYGLPLAKISDSKDLIPYKQQYERNRMEYQHRKWMLTLPYNGELGPQSYKSWQMNDYFFIRKLTEVIIDDILNSHIPVHRTITPPFYKQPKHPLEEKSILLIVEQMLLIETAHLAAEIAEESLHIYKHIRQTGDLNFMRLIEMVVSNKENGRETDDPAYASIGEEYYTKGDERNVSVWKIDL
ncbi:DgyrCDS10059 [Dimorphilus gyrociliatus]|uniref:DgyrCDS10059 n=1 Tax=Dimorphilus gyrociliatus TaxID=2664684 RepID=A0A7I8W1N1_9ANNE|nr:DgyrCDS10059 [Dimorphilus gyrociliatus]